MYAVKPWDKVFLIGSSIGTYAMGIGMLWRESNVHIIEKRVDPFYELNRRRRCVFTAQTLKLLTDLGCTSEKLHSLLLPALGWRFVTPSLDMIKTGVTFSGCAEGEFAYHCQEGALMRILRSEFMRFGGSISWGSEAFDAFASGDGSDKWSLRKLFGLVTDAETIITMSKDTELVKILLVDDPSRMAILFEEETGVLRHPAKEMIAELFGSSDVVVVMGSEMAIHMWLVSDTICWRLIRRGRKEKGEGDQTHLLHSTLQTLLRNSVDKESRMRLLPTTTPAIRDSAAYAKVSILGDGLLPVDPFEWRGDRARCAIEEASAICRLFYGKKYHRGNVAHLLRGLEQDTLAKRASILRRDLMDAEHFLAVRPVIPEDPDTAVFQHIIP